MSGIFVKIFLLISVFLVVLSGCSSTSNEQTVMHTEESGLTCFNEKEVGSNMRKRVCKTQEQLERERIEALEYANDARRKSASGSVSGN